MKPDDIVGVIAILMALTLVLGRLVTNRARLPRTAWLMLVWMIMVWAGIIAAVALAFRHFHTGGF